MESTEITPLLQDSQTVESQTNTRYAIPAQKTLRTVFIALAIFISVCLLISVPSVYFVYIPDRIEEALRGNGTQIQHLTLAGLTSDGLVANVSLLVVMQQNPPLDVVMNPTDDLTVSLVNPLVDEDSIIRSIPFCRLKLPVVMVPKHSSRVTIDYQTTLYDLNAASVSYWTSVLAYSSLSDLQLEAVADAWPTFRVFHLGSWIVNMHQRITLFPYSPSTSFTMKDFNISLTGNELIQLPADPGTPPRFLIKLSFDYSNPLPFTIAPIGIGLSLAVYYQTRHLGDVKLPSIAFGPGRVSGFEVHLLSDPDTFEFAMDLVGRFADGESLLLTLRDIRLSYKTRQSVPWLESAIHSLTLTINATYNDEINWFSI